MFEIAGKVALVTGGVSGIGLSVGKALLENGLAGLAITDIDEVNGKTVLQTIKTQYGDDKVIFIKLDVTDKKQFDDAFQHTIKVFKNLDIVINIAGVLLCDDWEREIAVNLIGTATGTILAIDKYLPTFKSETDAVVLNVASVFGLDNHSAVPTYSASKSGVIGLTRSFGTQLLYEKSKVRIIAICPGFTETPLLRHVDSSTSSNPCLYLLEQDLPNIYKQNTSNVSKAMIQMIKQGQNGSIWVSEDDQPPYEIEFFTRQQLKKYR
ncbi:hypothetical protein FQR65_LT12719 [Abscondita terminalis]|nr:hypothetical protein FQR65_LT12719 [Abscondita terminalis]